MRRKLRTLGEYVGHLVVGAGMFAVLLLFGIGLHVMVAWSESFVSDAAFLQLMRIVEKVILYSDVVFVVWWTVFSTYKAIQELHDE